MNELKTINNQLKFVKTLQGMHPELIGPLADLWNTLLDYRISVLKNMYPDELLDEFGLRSTMIRFLQKRLSVWTSEDNTEGAM